MADYGLKIFDASGNVKLDVSDKITRLRYSVIASAGANGSIVLSDIDGLSSVEISVGTESAWRKCSHAISRSGTTVSWTAKSASPDYTSANSLIFVFLYT